MGENIRRDTYIVTNALVRSKQKSLALTSNSRTKLKPSTPNFSKLSSKVKSSVKTNKVVISKKKLSPPSGKQCFISYMHMHLLTPPIQYDLSLIPEKAQGK